MERRGMQGKLMTMKASGVRVRVKGGISTFLFSFPYYYIAFECFHKLPICVCVCLYVCVRVCVRRNKVEKSVRTSFPTKH